MKLKKLLKSFPSIVVKGSKEVEITGICAHSRMVAPGNLFIAKKGLTLDGSKFIAEAISAGAAAVLTDIYDPFLENIVQLVHPPSIEIEGGLAKHFYQAASDRLLLVGVTGTNGKTTTSYLIKHLLDNSEMPAGLIGTVNWVIRDHEIPALHTTPELITNHKLFYEMVQSGCKAAVMEVSSHGLDQGRVHGLHFDVAVFTNLSLDHLDYHKTMEEYAAAKSKLFKHLEEGKAVVNADDPWYKQIIVDCSADVMTYGLEEGVDLRAEELQLSSKGTTCTLIYQGQQLALTTSLIGKFNVYNCLAAIGAAISAGLSFEQAVQRIKTFKQVPGRLERVANSLGIHIFVDYAHTNDAMKNVLETLNALKQNKILTVFGCGGNREQSKRSKMGAIAEQFSDYVIVTTDNPRQEDPDGIIRDILSGFQRPGQVIALPDRKAAIEKAVDLCQPGDILLIAGKGHETYQVFAHKTVEFDDRKVAFEACRR